MSNYLFTLCLAVSAAGCIKAPEIVLVDRATALEQQAAGSFDELERKLTRTGIAPRPVPLTPDELEALGIKAAPLTDGKDESDADRVDELLQQRCIGEAKDGTLADTHESCRGTADHAEAIALIDRVNHARAQLWRWMHDRKPAAPGPSIEEVRRAWTRTHARGVTCGGWIQRDDGTWEDKKC